jgi:hypothetical protein
MKKNATKKNAVVKKTSARKPVASKTAAKKAPLKNVAKKAVPKKSAAPKSGAKKTAARPATSSPSRKPPSQLIDARIAELGDWRGETLSRLRALIKEVAPEVIEEWKWRGVPAWYQDGMICTGETYKAVVKMTFAKGAALDDPARLFNSSLEGNVRRAIDFHEGEAINEEALKILIRGAISANQSKGKK